MDWQLLRKDWRWLQRHYLKKSKIYIKSWGNKVFINKSVI